MLHHDSKMNMGRTFVQGNTCRIRLWLGCSFTCKHQTSSEQNILDSQKRDLLRVQEKCNFTVRIGSAYVILHRSVSCKHKNSDYILFYETFHHNIENVRRVYPCTGYIMKYISDRRERPF